MNYFILNYIIQHSIISIPLKTDICKNNNKKCIFININKETKEIYDMFNLLI